MKWRPRPRQRRHRPSDPVFYVYALIDPRDGEEFYYGKGVGKRHAQHVQEWRRKWGGGRGNQTKLDRIGAIFAAGHKVQVRILARGLTEHAAYVQESRQIIAARNAGRTIANMQPGITDPRSPRLRALLFAAKLVRSELAQFPSKRGLQQAIASLHGRQPNPAEYAEWLKELKQLAAMRAAIDKNLAALDACA